MGLADHTSNTLKHRPWATDFAFAMPRVEKGVHVYKFIFWFPEDVPIEVEQPLLYQTDELDG